MRSVNIVIIGGLPPKYYFRQLFFGMLFTTYLVFMFTRDPYPVPVGMWAFVIISSILYPYSRYVYENIVNFVVGKNVFFVNAFVLLFAKIMTMALCYAFAVIIAPIGLAYLYFFRKKEITQS